MHSHSDTILWGLVLMQAEGRALKVVVCRQTDMREGGTDMLDLK